MGFHVSQNYNFPLIYLTGFFARSQCVMEKQVLLFPSLLHLKGYFNCLF